MPDSPSDRPRLCVAMIVRNADDTIRETLDCVSEVADELVIADTGSTDRTPEILRQRNVTMVQIPWMDSFSEARNACLLNVQADWVLWLDAGEHLRGDEPERLREFVQQRADPSRAYMMLVKAPRLPGSIAAEQVARVRLVPNQPGIRFEGRVRESLLPSLNSLELGVDGIPWRIYRSVRDSQPDQKQHKANRDLRIADLEIREVGPIARLLNCRGDALQVLEDTNGAIECFSHSIRVAESGSPEMLEAYYGLLTALDGTDPTREKQLSLCLQALQAFPMDAQLLCAMGGYLQTQSRVDLACRAYQTAYRYGRVEPRAWHLDEITDIAAVCYSLSLQLQDHEDQALRTLEGALDARPKSQRIRRHLTELYIKQHHREKALAQADLLPQPDELRDSLQSAVRGACLASQKNWPAAKAYLQAAYRSGCRDPICLRWYTITLLTFGDHATAHTVIEEWKKVDPANVEAQRYLQRAAAPADAVTTTDRDLRIDPRQPAPAARAAMTSAPVNSVSPHGLAGPTAPV